MSETFIPPDSRYRLYFDETGTGDLKAHKKDANQRYLSLTGIVFRQETHDTTFSASVSAFKQNIFQTTDVILHRRDIIDRNGIFAVLEDDKIRANFNSQFANLVENLPGPAFTVSIDKEAHLEKYKVWQFSPYHYAMTCLLERFVLWLHYSGKVGDVIGEARGPKYDAQLRRAFRFFYMNGTTVRTEVIQKRLISRELRLRPKETNIAAVQIADLLAHPAHRAYKFEKLGIEQPNDFGTSLANILRKKIYHRSWFGKIEGYGRKWLP